MEKWLRLLMAGLLPFVWMSCRSTASVGTVKAPSEAKVAIDDDDDDDSTVDAATADEKEKDAEIARKAWELYRKGAGIDVIMASASGNANRNRQISNEEISYRDLSENIEMGNEWGIEEMIRAGMDLNEPDSHGSLPMQYAMKGSVDVIRRMWECGADVNGRSGRAGTEGQPVKSAVAYRRLDILKFLVEKGADLNLAAKDGGLICSAMFDIEILKYLLSKGVSPDIRDADGRTALMWPRSAQAMEILLEAGGDPFAEDNHGLTPMLSALKDYDYPRVKCLMEHGVPCNDPRLLYMAANYGDIECVKRLLDGGMDVNGFDSGLGATPLYVVFPAPEGVSAEKSEAMARYLISRGADLTIGTSRSEYAFTSLLKMRTSLYRIARYGSAGLLKYAMEKVGRERIQELYARDVVCGAAGDASTEKLSCIFSFIDASAIGGNVLGGALLEAVEADGMEAAKLLLSKGADTTFEDILWDRNALQAAIRNKNKEMLLFLLEKGEWSGKSLSNALCTAANKGEPEYIELLLKHGADVNAMGDEDDDEERSPLAIAIKNCNFRVVECLVANGADVNRKDVYGIGMLHKAAEQGNASIISLLLAKGLDVSAKNRLGKTPIMIALENSHSSLPAFKRLVNSLKGKEKQEILDDALCRAIKNGNRKVASFILANWRDDCLQDSGEGHASLHDTIRRHDFDGAMELIRNGADVNATDENGFTPLDCAVKGIVTSEIMHSLIAKGAKFGKAKASLKCLNFSIMDREIVEFMLKNGADVNEKGPGLTPLLRALSDTIRRKDNDVSAIKRLIDAGADVNLKHEKTPLEFFIYAVAEERRYRFCDRQDVLKLLLDNGADPNVGMPLAMAVNECDYDAASLMLDYCKSLESNESNETTMFRAIAAGRMDVARKMKSLMPERKDSRKHAEGFVRELALAGNTAGISRMIDATGVDVNSRDENGDSPLFVALDINGRHIDTARFLIAHGADINAKGNGDETLLHCAAKLDIALVRYLVEHGLDVNARNKEGATPLYHAIVNDRLDIAEYLISRGADIATSITGSTPLIVCAAISSSRKTLEYLVKNGVDINATDDDGLNAMHVAAAVNPNTATRRFLAEKGFAEPSESELKKAAKKYKSAYFGFLYHPYTFKHEDIIKYM